MRIYKYLTLLITCCLLGSGCESDCDWVGPDGDFSEGRVSVRLQVSDASVIQTRAGDNVSEEAIENVTLLVYKKTGTENVPASWTLQDKAYQQLIDDNDVVSLYLTADEVHHQRVYAICNLADTSVVAWDKVQTVEALRTRNITIEKPDGAYTGKYVMCGFCKIDYGATLKKEYTIEVKRLAAKFDFDIFFQPTASGDKFIVSELSMHNIPMGSRLLEDTEGDKDTLNFCENDYGYDNVKGAHNSDLYHPSTPVAFDTQSGTGADYAASFRMFENRQGGVEDKPENWRDLEGLIDNIEGVPEGYPDLYRYYQQIYKGTKNGEGHATSRPLASYLTIKGIYTKAGGGAYEAVYSIYLGKDNYKDYNVLRNHHYVYQIRIYDIENLDTRVSFRGIDDLAIFGDTAQVLDAHPNALQLLLYSMNDWTARVAEPDSTPWLEVSNSLAYVPRMAGGNREDQASFRMTGKGGLQYIYIHTDEYVPKMDNPTENDYFGIREGKVIFESGDERKEVVIKQYPAQMVICHIKYDVHTMKEVQDTFYVERVFEKNNIAWGFEKYWSFITDDLIASGQWDGLSNTRKLYDVALNGDKWGVEPAYKEGIPPYIALGYALGKNRDRNGNGKIDYNEIVWYLPAANELLALSGHIGGGADDCYDVQYRGSVAGLTGTGNLHSSTPSVADPAGETVGRVYFVNLTTGKKSLNLRSRYLNVLCCRRKNAWKGPDSGGSDGNVDNDPGWDDEEEEIMPKGN